MAMRMRKLTKKQAVLLGLAGGFLGTILLGRAAAEEDVHPLAVCATLCTATYVGAHLP